MQEEEEVENKVKQEDEHDNDNDMTTEENFNFKFKNQQEKRTPSPQHIKLKLPMSALAPTSFDLTDRDAVRQLMSNQRHHMRQLDTGMYKKTVLYIMLFLFIGDLPNPLKYMKYNFVSENNSVVRVCSTDSCCEFQ